MEATAVKVPEAGTIGRLRTAEILTAIILPLVILVALAGLFMPGLYRDTAWVVPQNRGTDLVTLLVAVPALFCSLLGLRRGSARAAIAWFGLIGYVLYIYFGATFAYALNLLYPIYVLLFSLSIAALVAGASSIDPAAVARRFDAAVPRGPVVAFLLLIAALLTMLWVGQLIPFFTTGTIPEGITLSGNSTLFVYGLDLGVVVPLAVLAALWLWRRLPWGYILAGVVLIKAATMGLALLGMTWFAVRASIPAAVELVVSYLFIALGGLAMSVWFFRHCRG